MPHTFANYGMNVLDKANIPSQKLRASEALGYDWESFAQIRVLKLESAQIILMIVAD